MSSNQILPAIGEICRDTKGRPENCRKTKGVRFGGFWGLELRNALPKRNIIQGKLVG